MLLEVKTASRRPLDKFARGALATNGVTRLQGTCKFRAEARRLAHRTLVLVTKQAHSDPPIPPATPGPTDLLGGVLAQHRAASVSSPNQLTDKYGRPTLSFAERLSRRRQGLAEKEVTSAVQNGIGRLVADRAAAEA